MKKITTLVLIALLLLFAAQAFAQNLIAVQNGNTPDSSSRLTMRLSTQWMAIPFKSPEAHGTLLNPLTSGCI